MRNTNELNRVRKMNIRCNVQMYNHYTAWSTENVNISDKVVPFQNVCLLKLLMEHLVDASLF